MTSLTLFLRQTLLVLFTLFCGLSNAQKENEDTCFKAHLYNKEYDVFIKMDFYDMNVNVPSHELYGPVAGYLGHTPSTFYWIILSAETKGRTAKIQMVNDYGSEDLEATLKQLNDSTYQLTQGNGSSIKLPNKGKWMKLPRTLEFKVKP